MPKYYLHICNGVPIRDDTGSHYRDFKEARAAALRGISELIAATIVEGEKVNLAHSVVIEDHHNQHLETIRWSDLFVEHGTAQCDFSSPSK